MKGFLVAAALLLSLAVGCAAGPGDEGGMWACAPENPTEIAPTSVEIVDSLPEFLRRVADAEERCAAAAASEGGDPGPATATPTLQLDADQFRVVSLVELLRLRFLAAGESERTR